MSLLNSTLSPERHTSLLNPYTLPLRAIPNLLSESAIPRRVAPTAPVRESPGRRPSSPALSDVGAAFDRLLDEVLSVRERASEDYRGEDFTPGRMPANVRRFRSRLVRRDRPLRLVETEDELRTIADASV